MTRNFVENANVNGLVRKIMLLPWQPDDMTHLSYEQSEKDESFFLVRLILFRMTHLYQIHKLNIFLST